MRSWTSPSSSTARPSEQTQLRAMCAAPMAYERSTTSSSGSPASTRTWTRPSTISAVARPPPGAVDPADLAPEPPACRTAASAQPAPAERRRGGRAGHVDLLDRRTRRPANGVGDARRAHDPDHAGAVPAHAGGDRRALRAEPHACPPGPTATRTGPPVLVGQAPGVGRPPASRPCRRTPRRWPAGWPARRRARTTRRRSRGRRARPRWCAGSGPSRPSGRASGGVGSTVVRRPCTLPAARRASASVSPTA